MQNFSTTLGIYECDFVVDFTTPLFLLAKQLWLPWVVWQAKVYPLGGRGKFWPDGQGKCLLILSAQPPHHYLVCARSPLIPGNLGARESSGDGLWKRAAKSKWQMDRRPRTKQLVVSARASAGKIFKVLFKHSSKKLFSCSKFSFSSQFFSILLNTFRLLDNFSKLFLQLSPNWSDHVLK